jgi:hypothetical protein
MVLVRLASPETSAFSSYRGSFNTDSMRPASGDRSRRVLERTLSEGQDPTIGNPGRPGILHHAKP